MFEWTHVEQLMGRPISCYWLCGPPTAILAQDLKWSCKANESHPPWAIVLLILFALQSLAAGLSWQRCIKNGSPLGFNRRRTRLSQGFHKGEKPKGSGGSARKATANRSRRSRLQSKSWNLASSLDILLAVKPGNILSSAALALLTITSAVFLLHEMFVFLMDRGYSLKWSLAIHAHLFSFSQLAEQKKTHQCPYHPWVLNLSCWAVLHSSGQFRRSSSQSCDR